MSCLRIKGLDFRLQKCCKAFILCCRRLATWFSGSSPTKPSKYFPTLPCISHQGEPVPRSPALSIFPKPTSSRVLDAHSSVRRPGITKKTRTLFCETLPTLSLRELHAEQRAREELTTTHVRFRVTTKGKGAWANWILDLAPGGVVTGASLTGRR